MALWSLYHKLELYIEHILYNYDVYSHYISTVFKLKVSIYLEHMIMVNLSLVSR